MIPARYKVMAHLHFCTCALCSLSGVGSIVTQSINWLTPITFGLAALNLWMGLQRWEGK